jgi:hypothetical protein
VNSQARLSVDRTRRPADGRAGLAVAVRIQSPSGSICWPLSAKTVPDPSVAAMGRAIRKF